MPTTESKQKESTDFAALAAELSEHHRELVAVAASVAAGCRPCTKFHVKAAQEAGATPGEIRRAVEDATAVTQSAASAMATLATDGLDGAEAATSYDDDALAQLVPAGAAFAVNCASEVKDRVEAAKQGGTTDRQVEATLGVARMVKRVAANRAEESIAKVAGSGPEPSEGGGSCCGPQGADGDSQAACS
jgi:AhpD family alkylhydroperoxidase